MEPELICWGEPSFEAYCTIHEDYEPQCPTCRFCKAEMDRHELKRRKRKAVPQSEGQK